MTAQLSKSFEDLPQEIRAIILFNNLSLHDITNCYLANKIFHCLNETQLETIKHVKNGFTP